MNNSAPVPVDKAGKPGTPKILFVLLAVVAFAALFMFVLKPMLLGDNSAPKSPAHAIPAAVTGPGTPATTKPGDNPPGSDDVNGAKTTSVHAANMAQRDPFVPLSGDTPATTPPAK